MFKVMAVVLLLMVAVPVKADDYSRLALSVELMELCKTQPAQCELLAQLAKDNILFSFRLGTADDNWQHRFAELVAVPHFSCVEAVTPAQLREAINQQYANLNSASLGAGIMIFNALGVAAVENCPPLEV